MRGFPFYRRPQRGWMLANSRLAASREGLAEKSITILSHRLHISNGRRKLPYGRKRTNMLIKLVWNNYLISEIKHLTHLHRKIMITHKINLLNHKFFKLTIMFYPSSKIWTLPKFQNWFLFSKLNFSLWCHIIWILMKHD